MISPFRVEIDREGNLDRLLQIQGFLTVFLDSCYLQVGGGEKIFGEHDLF